MIPSAAVDIEPLSEGFLPEVLALHRALLGYSINSRLGKEHLAFLYRFMSHDDQCYVGVATLDHMPVGVVSGAINAPALRSNLLRALPLANLLRIALSIAAHPMLVHQWRNEEQIGAPIHHDGNEVKAVLTAILVRADIQAHGIGRQLVSALEAFYCRHNVPAYRLDTLITNSSAREFYRRLKFCEVAKRADSVVLLKTLE